jgi:hypothetical protein
MVYDKFNETQQLAKVDADAGSGAAGAVGVDGGFTPAAVYGQEMPDGQCASMREIALERGGMEELAAAMLVLEARRFQGCEFRTVCDPSMVAGEDKDPDRSASEPQISKGSDRQRLAKARPQGRARGVERRRPPHDAVRAKIGDGPAARLSCSIRPARA